MRKIIHSSRFKKDFKKLMRSGRFNLQNFKFVVDQIASDIELPKKYADHKLGGDLSAFRECHLEPDLLLVYSLEDEALMLFLFRIGSHSEIF